MSEIAYPYLPEGEKINYVPMTHKFMRLAKAFARAQSLDDKMPGAAVVVKDGQVIGIGANGSRHHKDHGCERVRLNCKSGEGYELCPGCHPINHSESCAILSAINMHHGSREPLRGAALYLWGHWWLCKDCWGAVQNAQIGDVYLMEKSEILFNREAPGNIVGRQFETAE